MKKTENLIQKANAMQVPTKLDLTTDEMNAIRVTSGGVLSEVMRLAYNAGVIRGQMAGRE